MSRRFNKQLKVVFLGGVGEIGKNMTAIEYGDNVLIVDCGCMFATYDTPGVDLITPDFTYVDENADKIKGIVLTHGHEDHIGGVPYLVKDRLDSVKIYGSDLTLALVKNKFKEHGITSPKLIAVKGGETRSIGCFEVEFVKVTHSISGAYAVAVRTPVGVVFFTGDFKVDYTPIDGESIDLPRLAQIGDEGVRLMLGESTNIERDGYTMSEQKVGATIERIVESNRDSRIIIATFASNVNRIQQIINICQKYGRKVAFNGRSMKNISAIAVKLGIMSADDGTIVDIEDIRRYAPGELCIITTGSQGEPMSALTRMASGDDKVSIGSKDLIVISSSPIPGNEKLIYTVINNLYRRGARVMYGSLEALHVSGHACKEELKLMLKLIRPQFFIPVHGEYRHLKQHEELAVRMGIPQSNIAIPEIGAVFELKQRALVRKGSVSAGNVYVDGLYDVGDLVLQDRQQLSRDGMLIVLVTMGLESKSLLAAPEIISRGMQIGEDFLDPLKDIVSEEVAKIDYKGAGDRGKLKASIRRQLSRYVSNKLRQKPMILPIITEVDNA
ncbi:MAG TPA: ribonuclease J [Candidatus Ornithoclostridium excrementipullorum]|nr:ribonuclease J [Candidatus Ornithoclostridium excrementipullorum]